MTDREKLISSKYTKLKYSEIRKFFDIAAATDNERRAVSP